MASQAFAAAGLATSASRHAASRLPSASPVSSLGSGLVQASRFRFRDSRTVLVSSARCGIAGHSSSQLRASFLPSAAKQQSKRREQILHATCIAAPEAALKEKEEEELKEEASVPEELSPLTPSPSEIQSLLMEVCDETSIAEVSLKVGPFKLHMKRAIGKAKEAVSAPAPSPPAQTQVPVPENGSSATTKPKPTATSVTTTSLTSPDNIFQVLEQAVNEGLSFVKSPKVGYFRKGRVVKGKLGKPLCEEGQVVKEGQVVCYLEQLGTQQPVETDITGEVVKVLWNDEDPVGYGDPLIAIRPSFPGILARSKGGSLSVPLPDGIEVFIRYPSREHAKVTHVNPLMVANEDGQVVSGELLEQQGHLSGILALLPTSGQHVVLDTHQLAAPLDLMNLDKHKYAGKDPSTLVPAEGEEATVGEHQTVSGPSRVSLVERATSLLFRFWMFLVSIFRFLLGIS